MRIAIAALYLAQITLLQTPISGTMQKVEKMSPEEIKTLSSARRAEEEAHFKVEALQKKIAASHGMATQSWMEWQTWVEFDGDFIVYRYRSSMNYTPSITNP